MKSVTGSKVVVEPLSNQANAQPKLSSASAELKAPRAERIEVVVRLKNDGLDRDDAKELSARMNNEEPNTPGDQDSTTGSLSKPNSTTASDIFSKLAETSRTRNRVISFDSTSVSPSNREIKCGEKTLAFDEVLGPTCQQEEVFQKVCVRLLDHATKGYNVSLFTYGQSGSGKTYTIYGSDSKNPGIVYRAISYLASLKEVKITSIQLSMIEIYNEVVYDLDFEATDSQTSTSSKAARKGRYAANSALESNTDNRLEGFFFRPVENWNNLQQRVERNCSRRTVDETNLNRTSTRAHTVLALRLTINNGKRDLTPEIHFVDLCGSEDLKKSQVTGETMKDSIHINLALTMLSTVVNSLIHGEVASFRSSTLTSLLRNSLGGNALTRFVICCSLDPNNQEESYRSAMFGQRLKKIKNITSVNEHLSYEELKKRMMAYFARMNQLLVQNEQLRALLRKHKIPIPLDSKYAEEVAFPLESGYSSIRSDSSILSVASELKDAALTADGDDREIERGDFNGQTDEVDVNAPTPSLQHQRRMSLTQVVAMLTETNQENPGETKGDVQPRATGLTLSTGPPTIELPQAKTLSQLPQSKETSDAPEKKQSATSLSRSRLPSLSIVPSTDPDQRVLSNAMKLFAAKQPTSEILAASESLRMRAEQGKRDSIASAFPVEEQVKASRAPPAIKFVRMGMHPKEVEISAELIRALLARIAKLARAGKGDNSNTLP